MTTSVSNDMEKLEPLYTVSGNAKQYSYGGKENGSFSKNHTSLFVKFFLNNLFCRWGIFYKNRVIQSPVILERNTVPVCTTMASRGLRHSPSSHTRCLRPDV